ncbi:MAG: hypothetical protein RR444_12845 [Oscillospiraceae bacterium]
MEVLVNVCTVLNVRIEEVIELVLNESLESEDN